jgi:hypothetical protein
MNQTTKEVLREQIISRVLTAHRIARSDLLGKSRDADLVAARKAIAHSLNASGFSMRGIARALNRDRSTIEHYLGFRVKTCMALPNSLNRFPDDVIQIVSDFARAERTTPAVIITEWINERARFEASKTMEKAA